MTRARLILSRLGEHLRQDARGLRSLSGPMSDEFIEGYDAARSEALDFIDRCESSDEVLDLKTFEKAIADLVVRLWLTDNLNDVWGEIHELVESTGLLSNDELDEYEKTAPVGDVEWSRTIGLVYGLQEKYGGRLRYSNRRVIGNDD